MADYFDPPDVWKLGTESLVNAASAGAAASKYIPGTAQALLQGVQQGQQIYTEYLKQKQIEAQTELMNRQALTEEQKRQKAEADRQRAERIAILQKEFDDIRATGDRQLYADAVQNPKFAPLWDGREEAYNLVVQDTYALWSDKNKEAYKEYLRAKHLGQALVAAEKDAKKEESSAKKDVYDTFSQQILDLGVGTAESFMENTYLRSRKPTDEELYKRSADGKTLMKAGNKYILDGKEKTVSANEYTTEYDKLAQANELEGYRIHELVGPNGQVLLSGKELTREMRQKYSNSKRVLDTLGRKLQGQAGVTDLARQDAAIAAIKKEQQQKIADDNKTIADAASLDNVGGGTPKTPQGPNNLTPAERAARADIKDLDPNTPYFQQRKNRGVQDARTPIPTDSVDIPQSAPYPPGQQPLTKATSTPAPSVNKENASSDGVTGTVAKHLTAMLGTLATVAIEPAYAEDVGPSDTHKKFSWDAPLGADTFKEIERVNSIPELEGAPSLIKAIVAVESRGGNIFNKGSEARGLMQVTDIAARDVGAPTGDAQFDNLTNIATGYKYLVTTHKRVNNLLKKSLAEQGIGDDPDVRMSLYSQKDARAFTLASYNGGLKYIRNGISKGITNWDDMRDYLESVKSPGASKENLEYVDKVLGMAMLFTKGGNLSDDVFVRNLVKTGIIEIVE